MVIQLIDVTTNVLNFSYEEGLSLILGEYTSDIGFTADGIFRRAVPPLCPNCGTQMNRSFWKKLKKEFFDVVDAICQRLRAYHVSYRGISSILELIFPRGKDTIYNAVADSIEKTIMPPVEDIQIVLYDEQHPKKGRTQKFRLTLLDGVTGRPIAEELYDTKDPETIELFLTKYEYFL